MFVDRSSEYFQVISWVCLVKKTHKSSVVSPYPPLPLQERERPWDLRADGEQVCHQEFFCPPEKTTAWAPSGHGDSSPTDMITRYTSSPHWFYVSFPLMWGERMRKSTYRKKDLVWLMIPEASVLGRLEQRQNHGDGGTWQRKLLTSWKPGSRKQEAPRDAPFKSELPVTCPPTWVPLLNSPFTCGSSVGCWT